MLIEDKSTECPKCEKPLTWKNHVKRWDQEREISEFEFYCQSCKRKYLFKDNQLTEKKQGRDEVSEALAIRRAQLQTALNQRCLKCGGPIVNGHGSYALRCEWCSQEYSVSNGELQPKERKPKPRASLSEFYAVRNQQR